MALTYTLCINLIMTDLKRIILLICLWLNVSLSMAIEPQLFNKESYQQILKQNINKPFLLVLWSVDCLPCHKELAILEQYVKLNPTLKIVLISTDSYHNTKEVDNMLIDSELASQELWIFSKTPANQLRYTIDPGWYGELPRAYFFNSAHKRTAKSGRLDIDAIKNFFQPATN